MKKSILSFFIKPFKENLAFFMSLWVLISAADLFYWIRFDDLKLALIKATYGYISGYFVTLFVGLFRERVQSWLKGVFVFLGIINLIIDAAVHQIMHVDFSDDMVAIIFGTNMAESQEFMSMYAKPQLILFIVCSLIISWIVAWSIKRFFSSDNSVLSISMLGYVILGALIICTHNWNYHHALYLNKIVMFLSYKTPQDFSGVRAKEEVMESDSLHTSNIVLIMGEALTKSHCSLYGYEKETTPILDSLATHDKILVFKDATSPAVSTTESFKYLLTGFRRGLSGNYWDYPFLTDVLQDGGYRINWISNQSSAGLADNVVAKYAELADTTIWLGTKGMGQLKIDLDEIVLPVIEQLNNAPSVPEKQFWFIHLMGSHEAFYTRYPSSFDIFQEDDYPDKDASKRWLYSSYDNSVLYTDYVVWQIIRLFENEDAIILFFPDHGMDIYESNPDYAGHALVGNATSFEVGTRIPFVIYPTEKYKQKFPEKLSVMKAAVDKPFITEDILYFIMDLANIRFCDNE